MGFKDVIEKFGRKQKERKERMRLADEELKIQEVLEERRKSANQRELERYMKEDREKEIKETLEYYRKKRDYDINYKHNPLDVPNITAKTQWNVLKEKNQFTNNGCMFVGQRNIHKSNKKLLKNNKSLYGI